MQIFNKDVSMKALLQAVRFAALVCIASTSLAACAEEVDPFEGTSEIDQSLRSCDDAHSSFNRNCANIGGDTTVCSVYSGTISCRCSGPGVDVSGSTSCVMQQ